MLGGTLALMTRALRLDARMLRSHLFRLLFVVIIMLGLSFAHYSGMMIGAPGLLFFSQMAFLNFAFITLAAISFFATSITEEKEEETLGLLKMAGISSFSLLIGKSAPRLLVALLLLSVQFPFTLLAITLGGVTLHQVFAAYVALLAYLFFTANLGLFCSVVRKRSGSAAGLATALLFVYLVGVPIAYGFLEDLIASGRVMANGWLAMLLPPLEVAFHSNIARRIASIMGTGFDDPFLSSQVVVNVLAGVVCFGGAWALFDVCTREQKPVTERRAWTFRRSSLIGRLGGSRAWRLALVWKDFQFTAGGPMVILFKFVVYPAVGLGIYALIWFSDPGSFRPEGLALTTAGVGFAGLLIEASVYAARVFHTEVKWQTLPALVMLPHSTAWIAYSKVGGCLLGLIPAFVWSLVGMIVGGAELGELMNSLDDPGTWFGIFQFFLFLHLTAYLSLVIKWGALPLSFAIVYIAVGCCIPPLTMTGMMMGTGEGIFSFFTFVELVIIAALHPLIGYRLQEVAAQ